MGRVCSGFFASSTLTHTPGAHRSTCDPPQYAPVDPNAINPLIRRTWLRPGTVPGGDRWSSFRTNPSPPPSGTPDSSTPHPYPLEGVYGTSWQFSYIPVIGPVGQFNLIILEPCKEAEIEKTLPHRLQEGARPGIQAPPDSFADLKQESQSLNFAN